MYEQAEPVRSPFSRPDSGQTSGPPPKAASDQRQQDEGASPNTYAEAERVYYTIKDEELPPSLRGVGRQQESPQGEMETSGPPPQTPPVHQGGSRGRVRHGNGADKPQEEKEGASHTYEGHTAHTSADRTYSRGTSGRGALCSFIRSHRSCIAAGIAVLIAVGLAPLTFINKEEISQLSTTVDTLKRHQEDMRQLSATVDALKRDQDDMSTTVDTLKRDQDDMRQLSATVDALKRDQDDMRQLSTTVHHRQLSATVDALKRDQDDMRQLSTTVESTTTLNHDKERNRTATLEQRLYEITSCPNGYTIWREICYKAFNTKKTFSDAAAACGEDGGTLAMPRDAETNAFLISLHNAVSDNDAFWFGLHDQREEGSFEWVDGSALGAYNNWGPGEPGIYWGSRNCVLYSAVLSRKDKWADDLCHAKFRYICQAVPGRRLQEDCAEVIIITGSRHEEFSFSTT
uniref:C-type lectin domain-containing protein n=1 Tax=Branchiostoma floridae TaxID=7739 RepID=C3ZRA0_BRAFL|eukprot:XP_002588962.1 hypothetical protein BRAFLDRAFT_125435 [Branchiostoma floridae]